MTAFAIIFSYYNHNFTTAPVYCINVLLIWSMDMYSIQIMKSVLKKGQNKQTKTLKKILVFCLPVGKIKYISLLTILNKENVTGFRTKLFGLTCDLIFEDALCRGRKFANN